MRNRLTPFQGPRLVFLTVVMISAFLVLVLRLFEWQAVEYKTFQAGADENAIQSVPLPAPRGVITRRSRQVPTKTPSRAYHCPRRVA